MWFWSKKVEHDNGNCSWQVMRFAFQGINEIFHQRVVFFCVAIFGCLIHWHWKAMLISELSISVPEIPFSSLEELISSPYQITTIKNAYYQALWKEMDDDLVKLAGKTKFIDESKSFKATPEEAVKQALEDDYAMFLYRITATNLKEFKDCKIIDTMVELRNADISFMFPKGSFLKPLFDKEIMKMKENGELEKILATHIATKENCRNDQGMIKIGLNHLIGVFIFFGFSTFISIIALMVEHVCKIYKKM